MRSAACSELPLLTLIYVFFDDDAQNVALTTVAAAAAMGPAARVAAAEGKCKQDLSPSQGEGAGGGGGGEKGFSAYKSDPARGFRFEDYTG